MCNHTKVNVAKVGYLKTLRYLALAWKIPYREIQKTAISVLWLEDYFTGHKSKLVPGGVGRSLGLENIMFVCFITKNSSSVFFCYYYYVSYYYHSNTLCWTEVCFLLLKLVSRGTFQLTVHKQTHAWMVKQNAYWMGYNLLYNLDHSINVCKDIEKNGGQVYFPLSV